jgi:hypothetical protein
MTWRDLLNDLYDGGNPKSAPAPVRDPPHDYDKTEFTRERRTSCMNRSK